MNRHKRILILFLCITLVFCACLNLKQPQNKIEFYTLEYAPPRADDLEPLTLPLRVARFSVAPTYNTTRIIYRDRSFARDAYVYHRWRTNPADMVTHLLKRDMGQSGLFKAVLPQSNLLPSYHVLEGSLDEFFESDTEEGWKAVLTLGITLMDENEPDITKRILFQKTYQAIKACRQKNPRALAEAMSLALGEISSEILRDIHYHLKDDNP